MSARNVYQPDFDTTVDITGIWSAKWGYRKEKTGVEDILPMWVADMDFETAPAVKAAVLNRAQNGFYGYTQTDESFLDTVARWFRLRHDWAVQPQWILQTPGILCAVHIAIRAFTKEGDYVLVQPPIYHPFFRILNLTKRRILENPLIDCGDHYEVDFEDFEEKIRQYKPRIFLLCNPHNPVGKVYTREDLERFSGICSQYGVLILSDEIHCDLTAPGIKHIPIASLGESCADHCITCTAPSKTFNLAGLRLSNIIISNQAIRDQFSAALEEVGIPGSNLFALTAADAAYQHGADWLDELRDYLQKNREYAETFIREQIPSLKTYKAEGTYFLWVDFRQKGFHKTELETFLQKEAGVWFNQGYIFGRQGEGFVRINIACPRRLLQEALERIRTAISVSNIN